MLKLLTAVFLLAVCYLATIVSNQKDDGSLTLVRLKDTIYHCEEVVSTPCGYYLSCGRFSFHCATNIVTEKIR